MCFIVGKDIIIWKVIHIKNIMTWKIWNQQYGLNGFEYAELSQSEISRGKILPSFFFIWKFWYMPLLIFWTLMFYSLCFCFYWVIIFITWRQTTFAYITQIFFMMNEKSHIWCKALGYIIILFLPLQLYLK